MTTVTFGAGGTYADWGALFAGILNGQTLADDFLCQQVGNITGAISTIANCHFNGHTVTFQNAVPLLGDPTGGVGTIWGASGRISISDSNGNLGPGTLIFDNLKWSVSSGNPDLLSIDNGGGNLGNLNIQFSNFMGVANSGRIALLTGPHLGAGTFYNVAVGVGFQMGFSTLVVENCCIPWLFNVNSGTGTAVNNYSNGGFGSFTNMSGSYLASSTGTVPGTHGLTGISTGANFLSTSFASANFFKLNSTSLLNYSGGPVTIPANTVGIRGNARPHSGYYSIGADEGGLPPATGGAGNFFMSHLGGAY